MVPLTKGYNVMLRFVLSFVLVLFALGCSTFPERTVHGSPKDCGVYFDYAGVYASTLEGASGDETWTDEFDIVVQQNGPAILLANILGLADSSGMSFGHSFDTFDFWVGDAETVTYTGGSRANDDPYTIDLRIEVDYFNVDYDYVIDYVIYLGDTVEY